MLRAWLSALRRALLALLPFVVTAFAGAGLALLLLPQPTPVAQQPVPPTPAATSTVTPALPTAAPPTATPLPLPADILSQRLREQELVVDQLTSSVYILKAAAQIQAGRLALRDNKQEEVDRELAAAWTSLDLAAGKASEAKRSALRNVQQRISYLQDDLAVRLESVDPQMASLWQSLMALLDNQP